MRRLIIFAYRFALQKLRSWRSSTTDLLRAKVPYFFNAIASVYIYLKTTLFPALREGKYLIRHLVNIQKTKTLVKNHSKVFLNLGGIEKGDGWWNVDLYAAEADLQLDLRNPLPFPAESVDLIYSSHLLEHLRYPSQLLPLIQECFRVLKLNGTMKGAVPDFGRALQHYSKSDLEFYKQKFWGNPNPNWCRNPIDELNWLVYMGGAHKHLFDHRNLVTLLEESGFGEVSFRDYDPELDMENRKEQSIFFTAKKIKQNPFQINQFELCKDNEIESYDVLWGDRSRSQIYACGDRIKLWRAVLKYSVDRPGPVLDIGCGGGHLLELIWRETKMPPSSIFGIDLSKEGIQQATNRIPGAKMMVGSSDSLPFQEEMFETVILCEIMEHIHHPEKALLEAAKVLKPEGQILITIPNGEKDTFPGHCNYWSDDEFRKLLTGFKISHHEFINNDSVMFYRIHKTSPFTKK